MGGGRGREVVLRLRKELAEFSRRSFNRGLVSGSGGNVSVRIPGTDEILITPTDVSLGDVEPDVNLLVNLDGTIGENAFGLEASKETGLHLAAYRLRPDIGAVSHVHPPYATAYSIKGGPLPLMTVNSRIILEEVPCIECAQPGSQELCDFVSAGIERYHLARALLMKEHGILAFGRDLKDVFQIADLVEETAKIAFVTENIRGR